MLILFQHLSSKFYESYMEEDNSLFLRDFNSKNAHKKRGKQVFSSLVHPILFLISGIVFKFKVPHNVLIGKLDLNSTAWPLGFCETFCSRRR